MTSPQRKAVASYRQRMKEQGIVRLELRVHKDNAAMVRDVARALEDPERAEETRDVLQKNIRAGRPSRWKELLASAPLGIDLEFDRDLDRDVDLS